jgi:hypothetical protein
MSICVDNLKHKALTSLQELFVDLEEGFRIIHRQSESTNTNPTLSDSGITIAPAAPAILSSNQPRSQGLSSGHAII